MKRLTWWLPLLSGYAPHGVGLHVLVQSALETHRLRVHRPTPGLAQSDEYTRQSSALMTALAAPHPMEAQVHRLNTTRWGRSESNGDGTAEPRGSLTRR
jgi:hypothetical protein